MAETGKKMGDYTPLESNKKDYFFGDGEGGVVAVGKTEAGGTKTNRLVKLSDIAGDKLPATTSADAGKALHVGSDGAPVFKFAELRQMPDVVQESASDNGHIFTNNTYTKVILKYNTDQDLYSPEVKLASDELLNCIIDIYIDSTYNLDGHDLFIMFDIQRNGESLKHIARPLTGDHFRHLEKGSYIRIHALGDSWSAQVGIPWNTPGWLPCQLVPPAEVGDKGKMLQVLDRDGNLGWGVGIPAPANDDVGKVLTVSTSESHLVATWEEASGGGSSGGGGGYTRATAAFGEQYSNPYPWWPEGNGKTQDITVTDNSYTIATNFIPNYRYYDAGEDDNVTVKGSNMFVINVSADLPMAIVRLELNKCTEWLPEGANSFSFNLAYHPDYVIMVKNGNKTLKRLYPLPISDSASESSYSYNNLCQAEVIEVHILGDSFTILSSNGPVEGLSV